MGAYRAGLDLPQQFNAAEYFIDAHIRCGRGVKVAIESGHETVTYDQLFQRVNRAGSMLRGLGVRAEERVLLLLLDGPEFLYSFFGAIKIGAVPVPANTLLKPQEYEYILNDCRARVTIVSQELLPQLEAVPRGALRCLRSLVVVGKTENGGESFSRLLEQSSAELDAEPTSKDDAAFWLYSSGSTGFPKACIHLQHDMVVCSECYARDVLRISQHDRCFSVAKLFFAYGLGNAGYFPLAVGATSILWPGPLTPANVYRIIEEKRPTLFFSVPSNYAHLLAHRRPSQSDGGADFDLSSIRHAVSAGEALPAGILERFQQRFGIQILDAIGSTEALHMFISNRPGAVRPGSSGTLLRGYQARIVDDDNQPVAQGQIGNLLIQGDSICAGYWNQHEKNKATFQGHWLRTGDKYYQDADGYFWHAGRGDDMLKVSGMWVSPVEIESMLSNHPAVEEAAVIGRADRDRLVKPMACVVLREGTEATPQLAGELEEFVARQLAPFKRPRWVEFLPALPKTATGKIQRFLLRQRFGA